MWSIHRGILGLLQIDEIWIHCTQVLINEEVITSLIAHSIFTCLLHMRTYRHPSIFALKQFESPLDIFDAFSREENMNTHTNTATGPASITTTRHTHINTDDDNALLQQESKRIKKQHHTVKQPSKSRSWWLFPHQTASAPLEPQHHHTWTTSAKNNTTLAWLHGAVEKVDPPRCHVDPGALAATYMKYPEMQPITQIFHEEAMMLDGVGHQCHQKNGADGVLSPMGASSCRKLEEKCALVS